MVFIANRQRWLGNTRLIILFQVQREIEKRERELRVSPRHLSAEFLKISLKARGVRFYMTKMVYLRTRDTSVWLVKPKEINIYAHSTTTTIIVFYSLAEFTQTWKQSADTRLMLWFLHNPKSQIYKTELSKSRKLCLLGNDGQVSHQLDGNRRDLPL